MEPPGTDTGPHTVLEIIWMVGLKAPSPSLLVTLNWAEGLMWETLKEYTSKNSMNFNRDKCKALYFFRTSRSLYQATICVVGEQPCWKDLGLLQWISWIWVSSTLLQERRQICSWAASREALLAEIEKQSCCSSQHLSGYMWSIVSHSGPHNARKTRTEWWGPKEDHKDDPGEFTLWERPKQLGLFFL